MNDPAHIDVQPLRHDEQLVGPDDARGRFGAAVRRLHHAVVGHHVSDVDLNAAAEIMERISASFAQGEGRSRPTNTFAYELLPEMKPGDLLPPGYGDRPFGGKTGPFSLEFDVFVADRPYAVDGMQVTTTFQLGPAHEGAPQRSHGGFVAAVFDDLTGFVLQLAKTSAYTGELTTRFHAAAPLGRPLIANAWITGRERRKLYMEAEMRDGESLIATCKAVYVAVAAY
jgi:acyl-coenzyme A thioesterase PaaI-like protein